MRFEEPSNFDTSDTATLHGQIVSGRGVASSHIAEASDELEAVLGERPFPGSLNVLLDKPVKLRAEEAVRFDGGHRLLWPVRLNGTAAWIYRWETAPLHVVELIAPYNLKERLGLRPDSRIQIDVAHALQVPVPTLAWMIVWAGRRKWTYTKDWYDRLAQSLSRRTGFGLEPAATVVAMTVRGLLRKVGIARSGRSFSFTRVAIDGDPADREMKQIANLLNYTKTSNTSYAAQQFPAAYHSIELHGHKLQGQREPKARLQQVPFEFVGKSVLDLGTNQGGMLHALAGQLKWGVGLDFDSRMVNAANRIRVANSANNLNFFVFDLEKENLQLIRDFLPEESVDVCFLLSVCMWIANWREVINFAASISDAILFESNGTAKQQREQIDYLESRCETVTVLATESKDDPGQRKRKLLLAHTGRGR